MDPLRAPRWAADLCGPGRGGGYCTGLERGKTFLPSRWLVYARRQAARSPRLEVAMAGTQKLAFELPAGSAQQLLVGAVFAESSTRWWGGEDAAEKEAIAWTILNM